VDLVIPFPNPLLKKVEQNRNVFGYTFSKGIVEQNRNGFGYTFSKSTFLKSGAKSQWVWLNLS